MGSEWRTVTLEEISRPGDHGFVDGPFGSNLPASCYTETGIPVIRGSNLSLGVSRFNDEEFVYVSEETGERLSRSLCVPFDIIFTKKGTIGQTGLVPENGHERYLLSSNQMKLSVDRTVAEPLFVYYYVSSASSQIKVRRDSEATGVPKTNLTYFKSFPILLPTLREQQAIAHILGTLDDKIELNLRMNETLESMARALFKSWFVDFDPVIDNALAAGSSIPEPLAARASARRALGDQRKPLPENIRTLFPAAFTFDEEMGWVPEGWEIGPILDRATLLSGGTPRTSMDEYWNGDIKWASAKDVSQCGNPFLVETERTITKLGLDNSSTQIIPQYSTVIVSRGATTGRLTMFGHDMAMNQTCYALRAQGDDHLFLYCYGLNFIDTLVNAAHGSVFDTITTKTFQSTNVLLPPTTCTLAFSEMIRSGFDRILLSLHESQGLTKLRDTLLPKLLSGELRIPDAEKLVADNV